MAEYLWDLGSQATTSNSTRKTVFPSSFLVTETKHTYYVVPEYFVVLSLVVIPRSRESLILNGLVCLDANEIVSL